MQRLDALLTLGHAVHRRLNGVAFLLEADGAEFVGILGDEPAALEATLLGEAQQQRNVIEMSRDEFARLPGLGEGSRLRARATGDSYRVMWVENDRATPFVRLHVIWEGEAV